VDNVKVRQKIRQSKLDPNLINICFQVGNQTRAKKLPEAGTRQNVNVIEGDIVFMLQRMKNKRQNPKFVRQATIGQYGKKGIAKYAGPSAYLKMKGVARATTQFAYRIRQSIQQ